jgi:hypothetical protein
MGRLPQDRRCHHCQPFPADGVMFMTQIEPPRFRNRIKTAPVCEPA